MRFSSERNAREIVTISLKIRASRQQRGPLLHDLKALVGPTSVQPGCISCELYQGADDPEIFYLHQRWDVEAAMEHYVRTEQFRRLLNVMEAAKSAPEFLVDSVTRTQGLDLIEAIRLVDS